MFLIYVEYQGWAEALFGVALILLVLSLAFSIREIQISVKALDLHLSDMDQK
jgi:ABC-type sulfate transport system permease component